MHGGLRQAAERQGLWAALTLPGTIWLILLFLVPFYAIAAVAFGGFDPILLRSLPRWNPLDWQFGAANEVVDQIFGGSLQDVFLRTFVYVGLAMLLCFAIGYPVAYFLARHAGRWRGVLLVCLVLPFWVSYLMRMLAWVNLLNPDGGWASRALNTLHAPELFELLGLGDGSEVWFGQPVTVVLGLVYGYIPFFILPLYASLDRLDGRLLDAARDLGASGRSTFLRVTLPLSVPGILAAAVITALPMFGDYYTNTILSGSPRTEMIGNQIEAYTRTTEPQRGAVLVLILSGLLLVLMAYYLVLTMRATREAREARA
ncbi:MAG TPA: ABC transporter permease [Acidimicrobiales bacterium]|nr:ABC transporter permease [Acidimicrobiales bacterium]